jgi:hypothetical protein
VKAFALSLLVVLGSSSIAFAGSAESKCLEKRSLEAQSFAQQSAEIINSSVTKGSISQQAAEAQFAALASAVTFLETVAEAECAK